MDFYSGNPFWALIGWNTNTRSPGWIVIPTNLKRYNISILILNQLYQSYISSFLIIQVKNNRDTSVIFKVSHCWRQIPGDESDASRRQQQQSEPDWGSQIQRKNQPELCSFLLSRLKCESESKNYDNLLQSRTKIVETIPPPPPEQCCNNDITPSALLTKDPRNITIGESGGRGLRKSLSRSL